VDPVSDQQILRKSGTAGIEPRTSGSVARNSEHQTTETVKVQVKSRMSKTWHSYITNVKLNYIKQRVDNPWSNCESVECFSLKKNGVFWDVTPTFRRNLAPPSSG
jgi:hypothetical protein